MQLFKISGTEFILQDTNQNQTVLIFITARPPDLAPVALASKNLWDMMMVYT